MVENSICDRAWKIIIEISVGCVLFCYSHNLIAAEKRTKDEYCFLPLTVGLSFHLIFPTTLNRKFNAYCWSDIHKRRFWAYKPEWHRMQKLRQDQSSSRLCLMMHQRESSAQRLILLALFWLFCTHFLLPTCFVSTGFLFLLLKGRLLSTLRASYHHSY